MTENKTVSLFGTDGIRGLAGQFPLDQATVEIIGQVVAETLTRKSGHRATIIIGRDTRESGPDIQSAFTHGAVNANALVESAGVITTPGVAYLARSRSFDAGVVISASHNPYQDNGIKVFSPSGKKLGDDTERWIEARVSDALREPISETKGHPPPKIDDNPACQKDYIQYLIEEIGHGVDLSEFRLALDCAHGAASAIAPAVFHALGADVTTLSADPDGRNINEGCGALHTGALRQYVKEHGMDAGIAFDGDADRALFADQTGSLVDGDHLLLILGDSMNRSGALAGHQVVATVMSNIGLEIALRDRGMTMLRTNVGDRYVLDELMARGASLGGEQSGHIIFPDISLAGDGIITAIETLKAVRSSGKSLTELASRLIRYPQVLVNVRVKTKPPIDELIDVKVEMDRIEAEMNGKGRLLVRYSGTESLARVMVEGQDQTRIEEIARHLSHLLAQSIGELKVV